MRVRAKPEIHEHVLDEYDYSSLTPDREYEVVSICEGAVRIVDDTGEPYQYPDYCFSVTDSTIPKNWIRSDCPDGFFTINPPELSERAFWDHYHDGDPVARAKFRAYLVRIGASPD